MYARCARISKSRAWIHSHTFWYAESNFVAENCNSGTGKGDQAHPGGTKDMNRVGWGRRKRRGSPKWKVEEEGLSLISWRFVCSLWNEKVVYVCQEFLMSICWQLVMSDFGTYSMTQKSLRKHNGRPGLKKPPSFAPERYFRLMSSGFHQIPSLLLSSEKALVIVNARCVYLCVNSRYRSIMCSVSNNGFRFRCEPLKLRRALSNALHYRRGSDAPSVISKFTELSNNGSRSGKRLRKVMSSHRAGSVYCRGFEQISPLNFQRLLKESGAGYLRRTRNDREKFRDQGETWEEVFRRRLRFRN